MADPTKPSGVVSAGGLVLRLGRPQPRKQEKTSERWKSAYAPAGARDYTPITTHDDAFETGGETSCDGGTDNG